MFRSAVTSSNIKSIGWEGTRFDQAQQKELGTLEVEFLNGAMFQYHDVQRGVHSELSTSESVGSAFHRLVKGNVAYRAEKVRDAA